MKFGQTTQTVMRSAVANGPGLCSRQQKWSTTSSSSGRPDSFVQAVSKTFMIMSIYRGTIRPNLNLTLFLKTCASIKIIQHPLNASITQNGFQRGPCANSTFFPYCNCPKQTAELHPKMAKYTVHNERNIRQQKMRIKQRNIS